MPQTITLLPNIQEKFAKLADTLEQASQLAREISHAKPFVPHIPALERPRHVPKDQEWFWSTDWQKGEQEVNEALIHGNYEIFDSVEALIEDLHRHV